MLFHGSKVSIAKSGTGNKSFENGNHKIVFGADDLSANASKDSVSFSVDKQHTWKYLVNPFVQPDATKPIVWNNFSTTSQRNAHIDDKLYNYDKTDTMTYIDGSFVCTDFASQLAVNFNGYKELGFDPAKGLKDNGLYNIPMYMIYLSIPTPGSPSHAIDGKRGRGRNCFLVDIYNIFYRICLFCILFQVGSTLIQCLKKTLFLKKKTSVESTQQIWSNLITLFYK